MDEIKAWLADDDDYERGLSLYNDYAPRYRPNRAYGYQVNQSDNSFSRNLLRAELSEIYAILRKRHAPKPQSQMLHTRGDVSDLPEDLRKIDEMIPAYYKKRDYYRYTARDTEPGPTLRDLAHNAVKYDLMIRDAYRVLDYWRRTECYPPGYVPDADNQEQSQVEKLTGWLRALKSYPSYISRNKNNAELRKEVGKRRKVLAEINEYLAYVDRKE